MFMIVGNEDCPMYEKKIFGLKKDYSYLHEFIIHASLDLIDNKQWQNNHLYLKTVDRFNELSVSAFLTPGNTKFLLLHENRNEETIKNFFIEVHELYVKTMMNPFYEESNPISSPEFDNRIKSLAKRFF